MKKRFFLAVGATLLAAMVFTGCLTRPRLVKRTYALAIPAPHDTGRSNSNHVLRIRHLTVSPLFEGHSFVYRSGEDVYEKDPYAEFLVPPDRALALPLRAHLRNTGEFRMVADPGALTKPDRLLEVNVVALYGDFRQGENPAAVLAMRFVMLDASAPGRPRILLNKEIWRRVPLGARRPPELVAGWNQALSEIVEELLPHIRAAN